MNWKKLSSLCVSVSLFLCVCVFPPPHYYPLSYIRCLKILSWPPYIFRMLALRDIIATFWVLEHMLFILDKTAFYTNIPAISPFGTQSLFILDQALGVAFACFVAIVLGIHCCCSCSFFSNHRHMFIEFPAVTNMKCTVYYFLNKNTFWRTWHYNDFFLATLQVIVQKKLKNF